MSDSASPGGEAAPASVSPSTSAPPPASGAGGGADDLFGDLPAGEAVFDRGWVDKIRNEGRRYREEARTSSEALRGYEDVYGVYEPADREVWFDLARTYVNDPRSAAEMMREISNNILGQGQSAGDGESARPPEEPVTGTDTTAAMLTREDVEKIISESFNAFEARAAEEREVDNIFAQMQELGYEPGTRQGLSLLWIINNEPAAEGDINKAHAMLQAERQQIIDDYVAGRTTGNRAQPAPTQGVVANAQNPIKNLDDARKATEAFLQSQREAM